jgi:pimeloyl-ACP methyl ester carboxylesterase
VRVAAATLVLAAATLALAAPAGAAGPRFERCGKFGFRCARVSVPLDRSGAVPGQVSLLVKRLRARKPPRRGALFALAGGPGQSATFAFNGDGLGSISAGFRHRDLIVFDQRGTGRSGLLRCPRIQRSNLLHAGAAAADCAQRLGPRRARYTTRDSVDDIEALRVALGYDKIALYGTSYGTMVALGYALTYPAHVERLVLDSIVPADGLDAFYRPTLSAVPRVLRSLCRAGCASFTRDPVADLSGLVARMGAGDLRGFTVDARGRRRPATLGRSELFDMLVAGDADARLRATYPGAVKAALNGDPAPLLRLSRHIRLLERLLPPARLLSAGVYAAAICEDVAFPWARTAPTDPAERRRQATASAALLPDSDFFPFDRPTQLDNNLLDLCDRWPAASTAPAFGPGPLPDVPVLILEGEDDLRTPVENGQVVAAEFPQAKLVVAPATGHSALGADFSGCAEKAFEHFFRDQPVATSCRRLPRDIPLEPPPPTALAEVPAARGVAGRRGRALTAVGLTLRSVDVDGLTSFLSRGGGLRGGSYRYGGRGDKVRLRGVVFVPGVRVTGVVRDFRSSRVRGRLRLSGAAVPAGRLMLRGRVISGRLGGKRVRARLLVTSADDRPVRAGSSSVRPPLRRAWPSLWWPAARR